MTIQTILTALTDVEDWDSITFGILPNEDPKGFLFPVSIESVGASRQIISYGVGILVSALTLEGLNDVSIGIAKAISLGFNTNPQCTENGALTLEGSIDIEPPQSYSNQSSVSNTNGFFTSVTFILREG